MRSHTKELPPTLTASRTSSFYFFTAPLKTDEGAKGEPWAGRGESSLAHRADGSGRRGMINYLGMWVQYIVKWNKDGAVRTQWMIVEYT